MPFQPGIADAADPPIPRPRADGGATREEPREPVASAAIGRSVPTAPGHVALLNEQGIVVALNRSWQPDAPADGADPTAPVIGANYPDVIEGRGQCPPDGCDPDGQASQTAEGIRAVIRGDSDVFSHEYSSVTPAGQRWYVVRVSRLVGEGPARVVVSHENVTDQRLAEEKLRYDALHDALTGLPNRVLMADRIGRCVERARRIKSYNFAVLFLDLDRFKLVNDSLGHAAGDELLMTVARRLEGCIRSSDSQARTHERRAEGSRSGGSTVARLGGDEFTILLEELRYPEDAARVAERIIAEIGKPVVFQGQEITTTASIGIVPGGSLVSSGVQAKDMLRDADAAMYRAKSKGRNCYVVFDDSIHESAIARLRLENDLRRALVKNELVLYYQPLVSLKTRQLAGFEALVRWNRDGKIVSPGEFIPVAEETGLIVPLGEWVLQEAAGQLAKWRAKFANSQRLYVSVNVSRRQLNELSFISRLADLTHQWGLDPTDINLEITENIMLSGDEDARAALEHIKTMGFEISMDDFGTGYSSLNCLHKLPIDVLKIDRTFLADVSRHRHAAAVVNAIVTLAHHLDMRVVAEGLEEMDQVAFLQALDCDLGQGLLFGAADTVEAAEKLIVGREHELQEAV